MIRHQHDCSINRPGAVVCDCGYFYVLRACPEAAPELKEQVDLHERAIEKTRVVVNAVDVGRNGYCGRCGNMFKMMMEPFSIYGNGTTELVCHSCWHAEVNGAIA